MWHDMFAEQIPIAEKLLRTVIVYALVAVLIRATGKRGLAALNTLDFVVMFLLSNVVQNAIIGPDNSVLGGIIGAVTLIVVNSALNRAALASTFFSKIFDGTATTVIKDGEVDERAERRLGLRRNELVHAVRMQDGDSVQDVRKGSLEPGGQLLLELRKTRQSADKGDVDDLRDQLTRIEALLTAGPAGK